MEGLVICDGAAACDKSTCEHMYQHYESHMSGMNCTYELCSVIEGRNSKCIPYPTVKEVKENESDCIRLRAQHEASDEAVE